MLGQPLLATVIHKKAKTSGKERAEIAAWAPVPADTEIPKTENKLIKFSWDHFNRETLMSLPDWIQKKIHESSQYKTGANVQMAAQDVNSEEAQVAGADPGPDQIPPHIAGPADQEVPF